MWCHQDLGQGFCQACEAPCPPNKKRHGFCFEPGSEGVYGIIEESNCHGSLPLANQLSFRPICHSGHQLFLLHDWFHSLTAGGR